MEKDIKSLVDKLNEYRTQYYNGSSDIDDEEFDYYERKLKELDPNNEYFEQVGSKINYDTETVIHKYPMLSMQKVQTSSDAMKWIESMGGGKFFVEPKLDGISGKIVYNNRGEFEYASTRGDGLEGAIIKFASDIVTVPKNFIPNSELRGEFVISKKFSNEINGPLRNNCSGILKRKEWSKEILMVSFVIYEVFLYDRPLQFKDREDKLRLIKENLGDQIYEIVWLRSFYGADEINKVYDLYVNKLRDSYEFETDGMIITVDGDQRVYDEINSRYKISTFNRYNMALKPPAEYAESVIKAIHAYVNRRKVSFVAEIEPVQIMGINISRATLDNYYNIEKNHIGIGTNCLIKRTNDVIPKIFDTFNKDEGSIKKYELHNCPCCGTKLIRYYKDLVCPNEFGCRDVYKSKIMNVISKLEAKNIGESTVDFVTDAIIRKHPGKMYLYNFFSELLLKNGTYDLEKDVEEYFNGGKRPEIFKTAIQAMFENISEIDVLSVMNIPYVAKGELLKKSIRDYKQFVGYIEEIHKKPVVTEVFDSILLNTWYTNTLLRKDIEMTMDLLKPVFVKSEDPYDNAITFCISGEVPQEYGNKKDYANFIGSINLNFKQVKDVTGGINYLVTNERSTSKVLKAMRYNIPIVSFEEFESIVRSY